MSAPGHGTSDAALVLDRAPDSIRPTLTNMTQFTWRLVCRAHLLLCLVWLVSAACATRRVKHTPTNESRTHVSWEIRTGGD
jgi:hypothetical protein